MVYENGDEGHSLRIAVGIILFILLLTGTAGAAGSGNRIWDESKGMDRTYTWNAYSFAGFYYNLNDNLGTEELTISNIKRTIARGDISYKTSPIEVSFDYSGFGKYQVIGFMADKYFAGYTRNSVTSNRETKSLLDSKQLHKVLLDEEEKRIASEGGTLTLKEGYVLKMKEVDISAGPGQIWVVLLKDGVEIDDDVVSGNDNYIYTKKVGSEDDMPLIAVHFDSVFRGREVNAVFIRGIFQISESYISVNNGDRYGEMEISSVYSGGIEMTNLHSISLSPGHTIDLVGDLKIVVADSNVLRFGLSVEKTGVFEARGTVYPATQEWTPLNFGLNIGGTNIGFYYDMDHDVGKENLKIERISGRSIPSGRLVYSTSPQEVSFDYSGFGKYQVIGFMADRYFAGYAKNSIVSQPISLFDRTQLHRVLLDDETKRIFSEGSTLTLKEGYVLKMQDVDIGAGQGQIWVVLLKDGTKVDDDVVSGEDTYTYIKKLGNVSDVPIIAIHFDSVFRGRELNAAFVRGVFQISESYTSVRNGDVYGAMEISSIGANGITMTNRNSIGLSSGTVDLMGNIKFRVADSGDLRFYPFVEVRPEMIADQLVIDAAARATAGDAIKVRVTAGGKAVEGATVSINSDAGQTDKEGNLNLTLQKTLKTGTYNMTATKLGYQKAVKSLEIEGYLENRLVIDAPVRGNQFQPMNIRITNKDLPVSRAMVLFDNITVGETDSNGSVKYAPNVSGRHTIFASKQGFIAAARDIEIRVPYIEFRALDINIVTPVVYSNENAVISANISNVGTKAGTLPVALIVNNTEIDSRPVTLAPGDTKLVTFEKQISQPGNYTVEILGQKKPIEVREARINVVLLLVIIIVVGAVIVYLLTSKGKIPGAGKPPGESEEKKI
ncbi:MAG: S-layer protein domain-containing protein [Candidatus Methanoperedens sp.]|nr:S-layer protein domain-containing protein [Candidatus Methanoperedens sp.]MCZ7360194.1 S-layer protein domain-containing protein [Candidatus Methanoperedens sp.]HLB71536.1 S-layer protein domain-containing protein [Candidatus Methanoperedens sp.]